MAAPAIVGSPPPVLSPTVHLNGTSGEELKTQLIEADRAVRGALDALRAAAPNARDYYPQGDSAFTVAKAQHTSRLVALERVHQELAQMYEDVFNAVEARVRR